MQATVNWLGLFDNCYNENWQVCYDLSARNFETRNLDLVARFTAWLENLGEPFTTMQNMGWTYVRLEA